tara:strand:- start:277 stop:591 length:315 start_codon:yes stop_codon:yes gene_type:complete
MKRFSILLIIILFPLASSGEQLSMSRPRSIQEVDRAKFYAYKERMKQRRSSALELRRVYNSGKVHKYWTAMVYPRYYPYYYQDVPTYRVERSEYRYDYRYDYGY